jgi:hypothetical protein
MHLSPNREGVHCDKRHLGVSGAGLRKGVTGS